MLSLFVYNLAIISAIGTNILHKYERKFYLLTYDVLQSYYDRSMSILADEILRGTLVTISFTSFSGSNISL